MQDNEKCAKHTEEKEQSGECCKQEKTNALDEFWTSLGEPDKCKKPIQST